MPTLACRICGRVVYTTAAFETLFAEETRCPRCGGVLWPERRAGNRRLAERRQEPPDPASPVPSSERRTATRRQAERRRDDGRTF